MTPDDDKFIKGLREMGFTRGRDKFNKDTGKREAVYSLKLTPEPRPNVNGISRDSENLQVVLVGFERTLTDDELRSFHECVRVYWNAK